MSDTPVDVEERGHPQAGEYVRVAVALCVVIGLELVVYYLLAGTGWVVPLLGIFAAIKFFIIGGFFMHLRFDNPIFRRFFITGLALAVSVFLITLAIFFLATPVTGGS